MSESADVNPLRVLIYAPVGRDADLTAALLARAKVPCHVCRSIDDVCRGMEGGAGAVLLTEEALRDRRIDDLTAALEAQPAWSDISVLLFAGDDESPASARTIQRLGVLRNVTLLERPLRAAAVVTTVKAALRGRRRQYELRDVLLALHAARNEAEAANRLKDEFLATLSHELRTPLNAILGWMAMLRQHQLSPEQAPRALEIVERNARAQAQLVADVLDVSRMITGKMRLDVAPVETVPVLAEAIDNIRPTADAKGVDLRLHVTTQPRTIAGDRERLQQVFWNLLSNAVKFTPRGGHVDVTVSGDADGVVFSIADTGIGLAPEFLPFVFDRFRQADQTFTRMHGGLGLGLAIVKQLVELHGGEVQASSAGIGRGATFTVRLPVDAAARHGQPASDVLSELPDFGRHTILVVDDDVATRELLTMMLERCGARVTAVESAAAAHREVQAEVPSLVLADIGMPAEDGLSMMRRLRELVAVARVPAIALSAYARAEDRRAALAAGFDDFLTKPALPADIVRMVERWLPRAPAQPERQESAS